ncbi:uncharacterized protein LOC119396145 [Rhipicephalus sanguineus]|uniref:uncharacterized protein LOC119396145 n=1 Tax=Rhipicephalus sanguineus TaxID=34632 RepID=UPI0018945FDA|nr:uncharacterized protein LOC119396145 [Rhipicephalus sanguineus]
MMFLFLQAILDIPATVIKGRWRSTDQGKAHCAFLDHHSLARTKKATMKKLVLILVVVLLCEVALMEAARSASGRGGSRRPPVKCNGKICAPDEFCEDWEIQPPACLKKNQYRR